MAKGTAIRENANLHLIYLHFETAFVSDPNLRELYCKQISLFFFMEDLFFTLSGYI